MYVRSAAWGQKSLNCWRRNRRRRLAEPQTRRCLIEAPVRVVRLTGDHAVELGKGQLVGREAERDAGAGCGLAGRQQCKLPVEIGIGIVGGILIKRIDPERV